MLCMFAAGIFNANALRIFSAKPLLLIAAFAFSLQSFSQNKAATDSLRNYLRTAIDDTNKVNAANELSRHYWRRTQYTAAKKQADDAVTLAKKLGFKTGLALAYFNIGEVLRIQSDFNDALASYQASLKIREELGEKKGIAACKNGMGTVYNHLGNYAQSVICFQSALAIRKEIKDLVGIAVTYNNLGDLYIRLGSYPEAMTNLLASLKIHEELGDQRGTALCYSDIGIAHSKQGSHAEALKNHLIALKIREKVSDRAGIAATYTHIGLVHDNRGNPSEALRYHFESLKIRKDMGNKRGVAACYNNIGLVYGRQKKYSEALNNHFISLKIHEEIGDKRGVASSCNNIGKTYTSLCEYTEAQTYLTKGLLLAKEIGAKSHIRDAYHALSKIDSAMGDYKRAYTHFKEYTTYNDSILNEASIQSLLVQQLEYEAEKKDHAILKLEKSKFENERQIDALLLKTKQDSLSILQAEKLQLETTLENERFRARNLYDQQRITILLNEKELQDLQIEQNKTAFALQKAEADKKQEQLTREKAIQDLQLKRQKQAKKYFIAGLTLFAILSFFIYRYYHTRQKLRLQTLRNKIASDLHDDVGSTLSSISIFSQMAQQESRETIPMLDTIGESSRKMLDAMADIVWTIKPENDQFEKIIMRMRSFAYELLGAKKIDFEFIADEGVEKFKLPMEVRRNLYLIFKEATNNMVKYSEARRAMFAIKGDKNNLTMTIRDDGIGFNTSGSTDGNGLKNMKRRAEEIGAHFLIDSRPGDGTTIQLKIAV